MQEEKVVETKSCKHCNCSFEITDKDLEFYEKVSPVFAGKNYIIPVPKLCPDCRQQRRLSFRNERKLYKRKCDFSGKDIISIYSPDKKYKVYDQEIWWSDKWDPMDYGRDFDFNKSFFEQFESVRNIVPRLSIVSLNSENSEYLSQGTGNKNCYLCFTTSNSENSLYSNFCLYSKDSVDCSGNIHGIENFSSININHCVSLFYSINCSNCSFSFYLRNCINCNFCFGCTNLINKSYYIFNIPYNEKSLYDNKLKELIKDGYKYTIPKDIECTNHNYNNENVIGDDITNSKDCKYCFNGFDMTNCSYCYDIGDVNNSQDCTSFGISSELNYEVISGEQAFRNLFSVMPFESKEILYCDHSFNSSNLFGCIGLRNKSYCILNKQYKKEEYEVLVPKIIEHMMTTGEWGEFFPSSISPFGYNETVAQEYFPLTKEEIENSPYFTIVPFSPSSEGDLRGSRRFNWSDYEPPFPKVDKIIQANKLPESISDIPDDLLNWAIECEVTKKPFRIIKQELEFYRKHNLPIPRRHPDQRHLDRMSLRNPRKLFDRKCDKCKIDMKTTYSPDRKEIVYCEECYNKEVY